MRDDDRLALFREGGRGLTLTTFFDERGRRLRTGRVLDLRGTEPSVLLTVAEPIDWFMVPGHPGRDHDRAPTHVAAGQDQDGYPVLCIH